MSARPCPACGCYLHPSWDVAFMDADREHFARHPEARSYIRPTFSSEHPYSCIGVERVEVHNLGPGLRLRREVA